ncbi:matrix metalloproteinase-9-like [Pantherophis guttatus]|uniref:Matrix metalloproteinase-9-like n=1 Tax=Pantherophis guttatus TaxID=94885 RepID=A0ABM3ZPH5_PANGU|nr:matrix metalloproteinase-9-like [Pantherophis guttatus]
MRVLAPAALLLLLPLLPLPCSWAGPRKGKGKSPVVFPGDAVSRMTDRELAARYLQLCGYLTATNPGGQVKLRTPVKAMQKQLGLPETGKLDAPTLTAMRAPCCEFSHVALLKTFQDYSKWNHTALTYRCRDHTPALDVSRSASGPDPSKAPGSSARPVKKLRPKGGPSVSRPGPAVIGGNSQGQPCSFPFKFQGQMYSSCTTDGRADGKLWCATTRDYDADWKWGFCPDQGPGVIGGNSQGKPCSFPFKFQGQMYSSCTTDGRSDGKLWCATTRDYDADWKWGFCPDQGPAVIGGNSQGKPCSFPFKFQGQMYSSCTTDGRRDGKLWCATTRDYDADWKWGFCPDQGLAVIGGNSQGKPCSFPFKFQGQMYSSCTTDGRSDGKLWCATTRDYDADWKWGFCPDQASGPDPSKAPGGSAQPVKKLRPKGGPSVSRPGMAVIGGNSQGKPCFFPFKFQGQMYSSCTTDGRADGKLWCATTRDYNADWKWGFCPDQALGPASYKSQGGSARPVKQLRSKAGLSVHPSATTVFGVNSLGQPCSFPFMFQGQMYSSCTREGRTDGKFWCATTSNYDSDRKWGFCPDRERSNRNLMVPVFTACE